MTRYDYIMNNLHNHFDDAVKQYGDCVFGVFLQGSQNYELDVYTDDYMSDIDSKCILLPTFDKFCSNCAPVSTTFVRDNNEHIDFKDIRLMFEIFKKQNINFVEILFTDYYIVNDKWKDFYNDLRNIAEDIVHAHPAQTIRTMTGMSMEKLKALTHPYPSILPKIEKYGYDGKQLSHIIRINDFMRRYISGEPFKDCLRPSSDRFQLIMDAKLSKFTLDEALTIANIYDSCTNKLKQTYLDNNSDLVDEDTYKKLDNIKIDILKKHFREELV